MSINHLEEAKDPKVPAGISTGEFLSYRKLHALIAIAEQLEKMNDDKHLTDREFAVKWEEDK